MEPSLQCSKGREVGRALAKSRDTEALSVLNLPNYRLAALSQVRGGEGINKKICLNGKFPLTKYGLTRNGGDKY